jgi:hypothetical protein
LENAGQITQIGRLLRRKSEFFMVGKTGKWGGSRYDANGVHYHRPKGSKNKIPQQGAADLRAEAAQAAQRRRTRPENSGRQFGTRNAMPNGRQGLDRLHQIVAEVESAAYFEDCTGLSAIEILKKVMWSAKPELQLRIVCAREVAKYEPHVPEDELLDAVFANDAIMREIKDHHAERVGESDALLRQWIEAGRVSEAVAVEIRNLYAGEHTTPAWEPLPPRTPEVRLLPPPAPEPEQASAPPESAGNGSSVEPNAREPDARPRPPSAPASDAGPATLPKAERRQDSAETVAKTAGLPEPFRTIIAAKPAGPPVDPIFEAWRARAPHQRGPLVLFTNPHRAISTSSGRCFFAHESTGEIGGVTDENDAADLIRAGCRTEP